MSALTVKSTDSGEIILIIEKKGGEKLIKHNNFNYLILLQ